MLGEARRGGPLEEASGGAAVQVGGEVGDEADLGAAVVQLADQEADALAGLGELLGVAARSIMAPIGSA